MSNQTRLTRLYRGYARAAIEEDGRRGEAVMRAIERFQWQLRHGTSTALPDRIKSGTYEGTIPDRIETVPTNRKEALVSVPQGNDVSSRPLVETVEDLLFHPGISAEQKILLMVLVWKGEGMTAEALAAATGMTNRSIQYSLRRPVKIGAVESDDRPDYTTKKFVTVYSVTRKDVADLVGNLPVEELDQSVPAGEAPEH